MAGLIPRRDHDVRDVVDRMFDFFHRSLDDNGFFAPMKSSFFHSIKMDVKEKRNHYEIQAELPGIDKDDIVVEYQNEHIIIRAEQNKKLEERNEDEHYIRRERSYGAFQRSFYVGNIDKEQIKGTFKNGVLTLKVPKSKELNNGHRIDIN